MKFYYGIFRVYKEWITLIPTIDFHLNTSKDQCKNFRIELHWLCFHARFMWLLEESEEV